MKTQHSQKKINFKIIKKKKKKKINATYYINIITEGDFNTFSEVDSSQK